MDPNSDLWINTLVGQARKLKELGIDGVQLDQIGGRIALADAGESWGAGYIRLIESIQEMGLKVWIQGLSDIYPADWFEVTYREAEVLEDGTIRGGNPVGQFAMELFLLSVPGQTILVPSSQLSFVPWDLIMNWIVDVEKDPGVLFLYDDAYLSNLERLLSGLNYRGFNFESSRY
jgi:hypothetical protein